MHKLYKVKLLNNNKNFTVTARNEEELSYNLKGIAETEFSNNKKYRDRYIKDNINLAFVYSKTGESWEEDKHSVMVYDRKEQKSIETYNFNAKECKKEDIVTINIEDYISRQQRIFNNKVAHGFNTTNVYQEARYILEEVAELMRAVEKEDKENILEELADIVIFSYGCAAVAGVGDLDKKIFEKMKINENRVYTKNSDGDFVKEN